MLLLISTLILIRLSQGALGQDTCPSECICHQEYLANLESWKWIEHDINIQKDDPLHHGFNPYTEHNEVYDNPALVQRRQKEQVLNTATCMLRTNNSKNSFRQLASSIQILSLLQAPGSGPIHLKPENFEGFSSLIGLEVHGYTADERNPSNDLMYLNADAFSPLKTLNYLNLEKVVLAQQSLGKDNKKYFYNYTNEYVDEEQVILIKAKSPKEEEKILPYNEYKEQGKTPSYPVEPQIAVAFTGLPLLQHLRISGCNLQDISWDMFYQLESLQYLLLDSNDLLFLPNFVFYATPNLVALSLSGNRILNLQTAGLAGLLTLQKLDISHNSITHLSELSLPPFPHMEVADFRDNPIQSIFPNTFEIMNSTTTLFLGSRSTPLEFSSNSFYGLISLSRLDIVNVKLQFLERPMLKGMPQLRSLTMTGRIERIMYDAFSEVSKLEKLVLKQCSIRKVSMDAFFGLTSLMELDLSHNDLTFLPPGIFEQQVSLREVFLQYNKLSTLPQSLFSKLPVKLIRLEGNPWHCSCDMKYWNPRVINQVKTYHVPLPNITHCDPMYYKPGACLLAYEPKLQVKYMYEKRVSPTCQSPEQFKNQNVFEVLRKGLHFCPNALQQNISILLTSTNPTETLQILETVRVQNKEIEKKLLFPPKVRKERNETVPPTVPTPEMQNTEPILTAISTQEQPVTTPNLISPDPTKGSPTPGWTESSRKDSTPQSSPEPEIDNNMINIMWSPTDTVINQNQDQNRMNPIQDQTVSTKLHSNTIQTSRLLSPLLSRKAQKLLKAKQRRRADYRQSNSIL